DYFKRQRHRTPGRGWKFLNQDEIEQTKEKLLSGDLKIRQEAARELEKKVKDNLKIIS
ncbi:unnamed protein product, partial [marine sediment metagenome]